MVCHLAIHGMKMLNSFQQTVTELLTTLSNTLTATITTVTTYRVTVIDNI